MAEERKPPRKVKPPSGSTAKPARAQEPAGRKVKLPLALGAPAEEEELALGPALTPARLLDFDFEAPLEEPEPEPKVPTVRPFEWTPRVAQSDAPGEEVDGERGGEPGVQGAAEAAPSASASGAVPSTPVPPALSPSTVHRPPSTPTRPSQRVGPRPKAGALVPWFKAMATMMSVGVPLPRALNLLFEQESDPALRIASMQLVQRLHDGFSLSKAMAREPAVFSHFHLQMIKVGETTGRLHYALERLAAYEERRHKLLLQIRHATSYPAVVLSICVVLVVVAPPYLLAGHFQMARQSGVALPWITRVLAGFSDLTRDPLVWLVAGVVLGVTVPALRSLLRRPKVQRALADRALRLKPLGRLLRTATVARFAQTLAVQLELGVWLSEALPQAGASTGFPGLEERIARSTEALLNGARLSQALRQADFFPQAFLRMVEVGEETGTIPDVMSWVARFYEQDVETSIDTMLTLFEPLLMAGMGILVAVTLLGTMLPMVKVLETL